MKNINKKMLLTALCLNSMSTGLLCMDRGFAGQAQTIRNRDNEDRKQEAINQKLDLLKVALDHEYIQLAQNTLCNPSKYEVDYVEKDIYIVLALRNKFGRLLREGHTTEAATHRIQYHLTYGLQPKRPIDQKLLKIFSLPSSSGKNR